MTPYFSVIIPVYNKAQYVKTTLQSVLDQTYLDFEIIIIDDGSTDDSMALINHFSDGRIHIISQENQGVASARNKGISIAKGKYIALIDADDLWYSNHLEALKTQIVQFPNAGLYCNNYEVYLSAHVKRSATFNFEYDSDCLIVKDYFKASLINSVAWTSAVAFSKVHFDALGGFNINLDTSEDLDLWIRMALKYDVSFNPKITMAYKYYIANSLTKKETNSVRLNFINSFKKEEQNNESLKHYLDINRYALAIRCKRLRDVTNYEAAKQQIDASHLNWKQKLLLALPTTILNTLKKSQRYLIQKGFYLTAFK